MTTYEKYAKAFERGTLIAVPLMVLTVWVSGYVLNTWISPPIKHDDDATIKKMLKNLEEMPPEISPKNLPQVKPKPPQTVQSIPVFSGEPEVTGCL